MRLRVRVIFIFTARSLGYISVMLERLTPLLSLMIRHVSRRARGSTGSGAHPSNQSFTL